MSQYTLDEVIEVWQSAHGGITKQDFEQQSFISVQLIRALGRGRPVTAERLAADAELPVETVLSIFEQIEETGAEFNDEGNLVGAALTLIPTRHRFRVNGSQMYAWCSLDTIFLPAFLGKTAEVESTDLINGETIRLTIAPDGVREFSPSETVLSIVLPGVSCSLDRTGPESEACGQMHFFSSRETAETWLEDHEGVTILTVAEAFQLAHAIWSEPLAQALEAVPDFEPVSVSENPLAPGCC